MDKRLLVAGVLIAAAIILFPRSKPVQAGELKRPILLSHRGDNKHADENTIRAYTLAANYGMDYIECDPRLTKDGVFVIMHDESVNRTTDGRGKVSNMTIEEIKNLRTKSGEQVPQLSEVFDLAKKKDVGIYLDTKQNNLEYLKQLVEQIIEAELQDRVVVGLWKQNLQEWMEENHPEIKTGLSWPAPVPIEKIVKKIGAEWIGMLVQHATASRIEKCDRVGLKVITMPINKPEVMKIKIKEGIHVLQTDDPETLRDVIREMFGDNAERDRVKSEYDVIEQIYEELGN